MTVHSDAHAIADQGGAKKTPAPCTITDLDFDASIDVHAIKEYQDAVADLLKQEKFAELDCIADSVRSTKKKFAGGKWKLAAVYWGLSEPIGHVTAKDWSDHLERLERWIKAKPDSITARVALAFAYTSYAWDARGTGFSNTVTENGWRLFGERMEKAKAILEGASTLQNKCPGWYMVMQRVAQGENWEPAQLTALLQQAIAFEPSFDPFYRIHVVLLLPKWFGEDGDSERFAMESADRIGGSKGDILYFQIAAEMLCLCQDEPQFSRMSWPRIQKGFAELEKEYGQSLQNVNSFALMAVKNNDPIVADTLFKRIGDNWDKDRWHSQTYFNDMKTWAAGQAPFELHARAIKQAAETNMQTPEGIQYMKKIDELFAGLMRRCAQPTKGDLQKIELMIQVGEDGRIQDLGTVSPSPVLACLLREFAGPEANKRPFPPPPHPSYWVKLDLDPSMFAVAAK